MLDDDEYGLRAHELLVLAVDLPTGDAYQAIVHGEAVKLLESLEGGEG